MTIGEKTEFRTALSRTNPNKYRIFAKRQGNSESGFERSMLIPPQLHFNPKFSLSRDDKLFTIGSCFARNIEAALSNQGVNCLTSKFTFDDALYEQTGVGARNGALNAYTPGSMLDLIRMKRKATRSTIGLLQTADDEWCDMLLSGLRFLTTNESTLARAKLNGCYETLCEADVVVVTLGYTESWFDEQDNIYVNRSPGANIKTVKRGQRYAFQNMNAMQVSNCLEEIISEIRGQTSDRAKIVLTISPVPMHGTFTDRDVVMANQYSKSTLLSAAVCVADRYDYVDYFPSYETVINSPRNTAWEDDGIHVRPSLVGDIMRLFIRKYVV